MAGESAAPGGCVVTLCRGCCCGTVRKHPGFDHAGQVVDLRRRVGAGARVRTSECLNVCDRSNVLVVQPSPDARRRGARPVWLGGMLDAAGTAQVAGWVRAGGPGAAPMPPGLARHVLAAPRWKPSRVQVGSAGDGRM
jgi:hypothetical protein